MVRTRVGNGMGWDEIDQSQFRPVYANRMKKGPTPVPIFFWDKNIF